MRSPASRGKREARLRLPGTSPLGEGRAVPEGTNAAIWGLVPLDRHARPALKRKAPPTGRRRGQVLLEEPFLGPHLSVRSPDPRVNSGESPDWSCVAGCEGERGQPQPKEKPRRLRAGRVGFAGRYRARCGSRLGPNRCRTLGTPRGNRGGRCLSRRPARRLHWRRARARRWGYDPLRVLRSGGPGRTKPGNFGDGVGAVHPIAGIGLRPDLPASVADAIRARPGRSRRARRGSPSAWGGRPSCAGPSRRSSRARRA